MPTAPQYFGATVEECHLPLLPHIEAIYERRSTAHSLPAEKQSIEGILLHTVSQKGGSVVKEIHYPLPMTHCPLLPNSEAAYGRKPLPTAPHQYGGVLKESRCPQHLSSVALY